MKGKKTMRTHFNEKAWDLVVSYKIRALFRRQNLINMASSGNSSSSSEDESAETTQHGDLPRGSERDVITYYF